MFEYVVDSMITVCLWSAMAGTPGFTRPSAVKASHAVFWLICAAALCKIVAIGV